MLKKNEKYASAFFHSFFDRKKEYNRGTCIVERTGLREY